MKLDKELKKRAKENQKTYICNLEKQIQTLTTKIDFNELHREEIMIAYAFSHTDKSIEAELNQISEVIDSLIDERDGLMLELLKLKKHNTYPFILGLTGSYLLTIILILL